MTRDENELAVHDTIRKLSRQEFKKERESSNDETADEQPQDMTDLFGTEQADTTSGPPGASGQSERRRRGRPPRESRGDGPYPGEFAMSRESGSGNRPAVLGDTPLKDAPEYKMFRYVDTDVRPGTWYQYRLQLVIEDPNDPNDGAAPSPNALEGDVQERVKASATSKQRSSIAYFGRVAPVSQPSNVAYVSDGRRLLAGTATQPSPLSVRGQNRVFDKPADEPTAKVMALQFDPSIPGEIPGEIEVRRGSVAKFAEDVWVPYPREGKLRLHKDQAFDVPALVLDIRGGEPGSHDALRAPGELLVWNIQGEMELLNELDDSEEYEQYRFAPEEEKAAAPRSGDGPRGLEEFGDSGRRGRRRSREGDQ